MCRANGLIGEVTRWLGWGTLAFSFWGPVIASVSLFFTFCFATQLKLSFLLKLLMSDHLMASTAGANPLDVFLTVALPLARREL